MTDTLTPRIHTPGKSPHLPVTADDIGGATTSATAFPLLAEPPA